MNELDEETALSILFANTKRKKRNEDLITIAKCCDYLSELYGSQKVVADRIGLSTEMIREFLVALNLPIKIQKMISDRVIDSIDIVKEISSLKDPSKQIAAAEAFANTTSKDVRDIKRIFKDANISIEDAKKIVLDAKPEGLHIFVIDFDDETHQALEKEAKTKKIEPVDLVNKIVKDWLRRRK